MSLYALSGPLFRPLEFPGCGPKQSHQSSGLAPAPTTTSYTYSVINKNPPTRVVFDNSVVVNDLLLKKTAKPYFGNDQSNHNTLFAAEKQSQQLPVLATPKPPTSTSIRRRDDDVRMISVQEVKIDAERLVKSLLSTTASIAKNSSSTTSLSTVGDTDDYECIPHEDAVEFALQIAFNGRQYPATRSMRRIFQLRKDLVEEAQNHQHWIAQKSLKQRQQQKHCRQHHHQQQHNEESVVALDIPPLPSLSSSSPDGVFVQGFANLQALFKSYRPAMEQWIRSVMGIVPHDSPVLTQFLWEPLLLSASRAVGGGGGEVMPTSGSSSRSPRLSKRVSARRDSSSRNNNKISVLCSIEESIHEELDNPNNDDNTDDRDDDDTAETETDTISEDDDLSSYA
jgi:hypothetical protein